MYGAQAQLQPSQVYQEFENDVEMYGAQAGAGYIIYIVGFENDVEMYGAQAQPLWFDATD